MATYIALMKWTDQGVRDFRDTVDRYEQAKVLAGQFDTEITQILWTPGGPYDLVCVMESSDPKKSAAFGLVLESLGNLRTTWMEAYGPDAMREIITAAG